MAIISYHFGEFSHDSYGTEWVTGSVIDLQEWEMRILHGTGENKPLGIIETTNPKEKKKKNANQNYIDSITKEAFRRTVIK